MRIRNILGLGAAVGIGLTGLAGCKGAAEKSREEQQKARIGKPEVEVNTRYIGVIEAVAVDDNGWLIYDGLSFDLDFNSGYLSYFRGGEPSEDITIYFKGTLTAAEIDRVCHRKWGCIDSETEGHEAVFEKAGEKWNEYCAKWDCGGREARQNELLEQQEEEREAWQRGELL